MAGTARVAVAAGVLLCGATVWAAPCFDHAAYGKILKTAVTADGRVDYALLQAKPEPLRAYLGALALSDVAHCSESERLAFWINAYNAHVLDAIARRPALQNIADDPKIFDEKLRIGQVTLSLNDIRDRVIRSAAAKGGPIPGVSLDAVEPLALFGLCNGAVGGPALARRAYRPGSLRRALRARAADYVNDRVKMSGERLEMPAMFKTYAFTDDFKALGGVAEFVAALIDPRRPDADQIGARLRADFPRRVIFASDGAINRVTDQKEATQQEEKPMLSVGDKAPDFKLKSDEGKEVSLKDFKGKNLVLYFYPKDNTPGCTTQACGFRDQEKNFSKKNAVIVGVSADSAESHQKFKTKYGLPFRLLSDPDKKTLEAYGVWKEKSMYGRKYMGIERTTFIIDGGGRIVKIFPKVSVTGHVDEVLNSVN